MTPDLEHFMRWGLVEPRESVFVKRMIEQHEWYEREMVKRRYHESSQREVSIHESYGPPEKEPVTELDTAAKGREPESNEGRRGNGVGGTF